MSEETKQKLASAGIDITDIIPADCIVVPKDLWNDWAAKIEKMGNEQAKAETEDSSEYRTPPEAIDAIMGNPPLGDLPPGLDGVEPRDTPISPDAPKMERGEDRYMSRPESSGILMELARKRTMSIDQVNALEMAVRRLMCRHFQRQRNWAKRRAEAQASKEGCEK